MADYLSREEILRAFDNLTVKNPDVKYQHGMQDAIDCLIPEVINGMEAKDVQPVKHGRWIYSDIPIFGNPYGRYCCSLCGSAMDSGTDNYCPCCGARMDGEQNET